MRVITGVAIAWAVAVATTGSPIARSPSSAAPTFAKDVAPIIYDHCATCHRPGQSAPFSLLTYGDVRKRGEFIVNVTKRRYMPPWHATSSPDYPAFRDDRRLSDKDLATLKAWVDGGMLPGDMKSAPPEPVFPVGWELGPPDLVVEMPKAIEVPAEGPDMYRNTVLAIDVPEDTWVAAIDFEPSARKVVHHALFFVAPASLVVQDGELLPGLGSGVLAGLGRLGAGAGAGAAGAGAGTGARGQRGGATGARIGAADGAVGGLGGWVPGMTPRFFPDGVAQALPAHSNLVMQLHLHPSGKAEQEQGRLAIYFAKKPVTKSLTGVQVPPMFGFAAGIDIAAGEKRFTIRDSFVLPVDIETFGARGHAHYLAKEMTMTATLPDGTTKGLLAISDWDFGWQDSYFYKTPFTLPKGTRLDTTIVYDNSEDNIRNPNSPPKRVQWGQGSFDEMGSMTLLVAAPSKDDSAVLRQAQADHFRQQLTAMMLKR
jgi:mono/diheme cytochrome c family protein